jgi:3-phenylpropionate/trans-cinnamate dioxygenase ferredoxin reductase subunit
VLGVTYKTSAKAIAVDLAGKTITLQGGEVISYEKLIIATGAEVRPVPAVLATDGYALHMHLYQMLQLQSYV